MRKQAVAPNPAFSTTTSDNSHSTAHSDYRTFTSNLLQRGNYFSVPRSVCTRLGIVGASIVCHLLNRGPHMADPDGFLFVGPGSLKKQLGLTPAQEREAVGHLVADGILEIEAAHYWRLDLAVLGAALTEDDHE